MRFVHSLGSTGIQAFCAAVALTACAGTPASAKQQNVPPTVSAHLVGEEMGAGKLEMLVEFNAAAPQGKLILRGQSYPLVQPRLAITKDENVAASIRRTEYSLHFRFDVCLHAKPVPKNQWPGLCGYREGQKRPLNFEERVILVDRETTANEGTIVHLFRAACVPESGAGPSCHLTGSRAESAGLITINGKPQPSAP